MNSILIKNVVILGQFKSHRPLLKVVLEENEINMEGLMFLVFLMKRLF